jgi:hypothetical protein
MTADQQTSTPGSAQQRTPWRRRVPRRRFWIPLLALTVAGLLLAGRQTRLFARASDQPVPAHASAQLSGFQEVPANVTTGSAQLTLRRVDANTLAFVLTYSGLTGNPGAAHIHIGQPGVNGGVTIFFCGGGGKPACPASPSGTVSGTITAADVLPLSAQGLAAGDLASVLRAMRAGVTYANMHTAQFPGGEIRGQIRVDGGDAESGD